MSSYYPAEGEIRLDPEFGRAWISALRSGKYKQTQGVLHRVDGKTDSFCCIGVACKVAMERGIKLEPTTEDDGLRTVVKYDKNISFGPVQLGHAMFGHTDWDAAFNMCYLMNDQDQWTFEQIADYAERSWMPKDG